MRRSLFVDVTFETLAGLAAVLAALGAGGVTLEVDVERDGTARPAAGDDRVLCVSTDGDYTWAVRRPGERDAVLAEMVRTIGAGLPVTFRPA
ncbi:hypothetical protein [Actinoplanes sp. NPDC020271]|uniref:hypothetical protein n=1 Tax=Actinoplanes sp. NPDC020271 TaxID=3363896 RepID=UPI00378CB2F6